MSAVGGTPVRKANVIVVSDDSGRQEQRDTTTTDSQGQFSFTECVPISVNAADKSHAELHLAINHQQQETQ